MLSLLPLQALPKLELPAPKLIIADTPKIRSGIKICTVAHGRSRCPSVDAHCTGSHIPTKFGPNRWRLGIRNREVRKNPTLNFELQRGMALLTSKCASPQHKLTTSNTPVEAHSEIVTNDQNSTTKVTKKALLCTTKRHTWP